MICFRNPKSSNSDSIARDALPEVSTYLEGKTGAHFESVFSRKKETVLADRIAAFRRKQEKKREKIKKILAKREAKKATEFINEDPNEVNIYKHVRPWCGVITLK